MRCEHCSSVETSLRSTRERTYSTYNFIQNVYLCHECNKTFSTRELYETEYRSRTRSVQSNIRHDERIERFNELYASIKKTSALAGIIKRHNVKRASRK